MTVGIIGTGWGARVQAPAFRAGGLHVTALAGSNRAKTERVAADLNVPAAYSDWRDLIADEGVQVVSIVTPPALHAEMAVAALDAGKHVICEKPTAMNADEARRMLDAARAHPTQFAIIDHELRFLPSFRELRWQISHGKIGAVRFAVGSIYTSSRADPNRAWNWWSDEAQGGGMLGAVGSHHIDRLRFVLNANVTSAGAELHTFIGERPDGDQQRPVTSDDYYSLRLRLEGVRATLEGSVVARTDEPDVVTIFGSDGALRWQDDRLLFAAPGQPYADITPAHRFPLPDGLSGPFARGTVYLADAVARWLGGERDALTPAATFTDGFQVQATLDAIRESKRQHGALVRVAEL